MTTNYKMYLTLNNGKQKIAIPVLPEEFSVTVSGKLTSVDVVGLGEILVIEDRPAFAMTFSSVFPADECDPQSIVDSIKRGIATKKPVQLIVTGMDINMYCAISDFPYSEKGGDVGSIYYSLTLKEYRSPTVRTISVSSAQKASVQSSGARVDNREQAKTYTVKSGDCLYNIAKAQLGKASRWPEIASLNGIKSPYYIYAKQSLRLPG